MYKLICNFLGKSTKALTASRKQSARTEDWDWRMLNIANYSFFLKIIIQLNFIIIVCWIDLQAARDGKTDVIKQRLSKLASKNQARFQKLVNKRDEDNTTPLHYAVRYGQVEVVKLLVELGAGNYFISN